MNGKKRREKKYDRFYKILYYEKIKYLNYHRDIGQFKIRNRTINKFYKKSLIARIYSEGLFFQYIVLYKN